MKKITLSGESDQCRVCITDCMAPDIPVYNDLGVCLWFRCGTATGEDDETPEERTTLHEVIQGLRKQVLQLEAINRNLILERDYAFKRLRELVPYQVKGE